MHLSKNWNSALMQSEGMAGEGAKEGRKDEGKDERREWEEQTADEGRGSGQSRSREVFSCSLLHVPRFRPQLLPSAMSAIPAFVALHPSHFVLFQFLASAFVLEEFSLSGHDGASFQTLVFVAPPQNQSPGLHSLHLVDGEIWNKSRWRQQLLDTRSYTL